LNLLSNAVKFTEKGTVAIDCRLATMLNKKETICITVKDTGIGMDEEFMSTLFQTFTQEDKTTARKYGGTGLGMAISKQLVELMNGQISVKSKKHEGTEITLTIPFAVGSKADIKEENTANGDTSILKNKKILLVEDNEMNRLVATTVLSNYGVLISEVENGQEAVEAMRKSNYDIILMDMQMPVMDGLEATRHIRKEGHINIPIIALTANAITGESDKCRDAGMNDFVSKPFEEEQLINVLMHWLAPSHQKNKRMTESISSSEKSYDLSKLKKISNGNPDFVLKMISLFKEQIPPSVQQIVSAFENKDYQTVKSIAHRIKPAIDSMGISSLFQEIREIEQLAISEPTSEKLVTLINFLEQRVSMVISDLSKEEISEV
jgi:CheY-like chemotaxis protein/HPt (histidine-containing phosphotransfer) domain-containing protein/anti-sigma regulatory factor (Ser/Thr protein kinase)